MSLITTPSEALLQSIRSGNCVLFMGAGLGYHLRNQTGNNCPDGFALTKQMCVEFSLDNAIEDLSVASQLVEIRRGRGTLLDFLRKQLLGFEPDEQYQWLPTIHWKAIYTTNFDDGLLSAYRKSGTAAQNIVPIYVTADFKDFSTYTDVPVYFIHGCLTQPGRPIVITQRDYSLFREKRRMMFEQLKIHHAQCSFLYVGYSHRDPNWHMIHSELLSEFPEGKLPRSFRIDPKPDPNQSEILLNIGIETIACGLNTLIETFQKYVGIQGTVSQMWELPERCPKALEEAFKNAPAMCKRLLSGWEYVGSSDIQAPPNITEYYKGTKANWSLIDTGAYFERDIEETIYDNILDFATDPKSRCRTEILLGSAGYGITTILMSIAWKSVKLQLLHVLFLKDGAVILEGDIEYALNNLDGKIIFIIDQSSRWHDRLNDIIIKCRNENKNCNFLLGSRLNEWRQERPRLKCKEYLLSPLSEAEIDRLIDVLKKNKSLGQLENLDDEFRRNVLINKHQKELLVIMRETIENNGFDAIIENEYEGIDNDEMKTIYGVVAGMHQYGILPRLTLLSDIIQYNIAEVPSLIFRYAEGIIRVVEDPLKEDVQCLITRHRIIAKVVWHKCFLGPERERLLLDLMQHLNLSYNQDKKVFDELTKDDEVVDSIRSFESRTGFFESACKKDVNNPYVRQHYARMLLREKRYNLALSQIEEGLKFDKRARILYHTQGQILSRMALDSGDQAVGEKYFTRAIDSFNTCIEMNRNDHYGYQSLAQLYIDWASRWDDSETFAKNISRCEEIISQGLRFVREKESLLLVSSNLERILGDQPKRIELLNKALIGNPASAICRYLLARDAYHKNEYDGVITLLKPIVENRFDEIRSFILYAIVISIIDKNYARAIAVLTQADPIAWSVPIFIATLGGMYSLSGNTSEAENIFEKAKKQRFPEEEARHIGYIPTNLADPQLEITTTGTVIVSKSYLLIQSQQFGKFFFASPKIKGSYVKEQTVLKFTVAYTAKSGLALHPDIVR
jgi:tetratricopeptide (TPR) repeat protein